MAKTKPTPEPTAPEPRTLLASVPIATGTAGWTGNAVPAGETLTTSDDAVFDRLVSLLYARAVDGPTPSTSNRPYRR